MILESCGSSRELQVSSQEYGVPVQDTRPSMPCVPAVSPVWVHLEGRASLYKGMTRSEVFQR